MSIFSPVGSALAIGGLVVSAITGVGASTHHEHADAPPSDRTVVAVATITKSAPAKYTDGDIVEFFVWGQGPAATARPDLLTALGITPQVTPSATVLATAVKDFKGIDSNFHKGVTVALQSHDPYLGESGINEFATDIQTLVNQSASPTASRLAAGGAVPDDSVYGSTNYLLFTQVAVSAALVLAVAGVVSIGVVFLAFYQKPADQSNLIAQTYVDAITQL